jgi:hypothetical protein
VRLRTLRTLVVRSRTLVVRSRTLSARSSVRPFEVSCVVSVGFGVPMCLSCLTGMVSICFCAAIPCPLLSKFRVGMGADLADVADVDRASVRAFVRLSVDVADA